MKNLATMSEFFRMPDLPANQDEIAAEYDRIEAQRSREARVKKSRIPSRYLNAKIESCNEAAQLRGYADAILAGATDWLVISGLVGRGKTYAACAIINEVLFSMSAIFTTMYDVVAEIKATFGNSDRESDVVAKYANVPILVIDDLGKSDTSDWSTSVLFTVIDKRYTNMKPTIFTTQYTSSELVSQMSSNNSETALSIMSRISAAKVIRMTGEDKRRER